MKLPHAGIFLLFSLFPLCFFHFCVSGVESWCYKKCKLNASHCAFRCLPGMSINAFHCVAAADDSIELENADHVNFDLGPSSVITEQHFSIKFMYKSGLLLMWKGKPAAVPEVKTRTIFYFMLMALAHIMGAWWCFMLDRCGFFSIFDWIEGNIRLLIDSWFARSARGMKN